MYGNNFYNQNRYPNIGVPNTPIQNNQFMQPLATPQITMPTTYNQTMATQSPLLGKIVDSIDVVKAMDISLDGSINYFPLTDSSAIITKQIMPTGISKITIYKPVEENMTEKTNVIVNENEILEKLNKLDNSDMLTNLLDEIRALKEEIINLKESKQKIKEK